ncbi:MAG TPA: Ig-like domain-containing protein, partial [Verrucomicrobiota bacterium]|nr:Ig-like domain-containing protein [Verrucomicrobiota bacterium]
MWLNDGAGHFELFPAAAAQLNLANRRLLELGLADLDGDGDLDIVARQFATAAPMLVWLNNGRGEFSDAGSFGGGGNGLALGDLDGDGTVDVFAPAANGPFVWLNDGRGRFTATAQTYGSFVVAAAALADLEGDGFLDAVVVQSNMTPTFSDPIFNRTVAWRNDGRGGFTAGSQILGDFGPDGSGGERVPTSVTLGDVNGDGAVDVVLTGGFRLPNQVWFNTPALPTPAGTTQLVIQDTETVRPFTAVSLRVPPADVVSLEVSLDEPARGTLLSASLAAAGFTGPVGGVHSRAASAAAEAEAALRQLVFGPAANRRPVGQAETTRFQLVVRRGAAARTDNDTTVTAVSVNDPPAARDDGGAGFTTAEAAAFITASVLDNDADPDPGDALTVAAFDASGALGAVTHLGNGVFRYDPRGRFTALGVGETASDSFTYVVEDPHGARAAARVFITVNGENQPPLAAADQLTIREHSGQNVITAAVLANDTDPDAGDALRLQIVSVDTGGTLGTVQLGADGSLTYSPAGSGPSLAPGATRADSFSYTVRDPAGATASTLVSIVILGENDPPALSPVSLTVAEDAAALNVTPALLAGASDPDPGHTATLRITGMNGSPGGGQAWVEDGLARYAPDGRFDHLQEGQTALDSFDYEVMDAPGAATRATATVLVTGVNSPPRLDPAYPVLAFSLLPQALTSFLLAAATDPDDAGATLRVHSVDITGTLGSVFLAGTAAYYLPPPDLALADGEFFTDTFRFTVRDPRGAASAPALATVFVRGDGAALPSDPGPCPDAGSGGAILIHHLASTEATATHVALPDAAKENHNFTGPFTVEFWMNLLRPAGWAADHEALINKGDSAWRVQRRANTRHLAFDVTGLEPLILRSEREVVHGWHHVAAVYDGRYKLLYLDGELDAWAEVTGTPAGNDHPVWLGANSERPGRNFHGFMDEVRIWDHARSA